MAAVARLYAARPTVSRAVRPLRLHAPSLVTTNANQTVEYRKPVPSTASAPTHDSALPLAYALPDCLSQLVRSVASGASLVWGTRAAHPKQRVKSIDTAGFLAPLMSTLLRAEWGECADSDQRDLATHRGFAVLESGTGAGRSEGCCALPRCWPTCVCVGH